MVFLGACALRIRSGRTETCSGSTKGGNQVRPRGGWFSRRVCAGCLCIRIDQVVGQLSAKHGQSKEQIMSENQPQEQRQIQLRIDESKMSTTYANTIRTSTTQDEVVLDFGMNLPVPGQDNQPSLMFAVGSRVVMNWAGAKRLAISLGQVVRQYEERAGEINLGPKQGGSPRLSQ